MAAGTGLVGARMLGLSVNFWSVFEPLAGERRPTEVCPSRPDWGAE